MKSAVEAINREKLPCHVGIIMDGNGRWATKRGLSRSMGHREGMKRVVDIVRAASDLGIQHLTLYAFSTENWKRPKLEIQGLMKLLVLYLTERLEELHREGVILRILGEYHAFPQEVVTMLEQAVDLTSQNQGMFLNLALNYGGKQDIIQACRRIVKENIQEDQINEELFAQYLYTAGQPDVDLMMRPSGELRLSNFLVYQCAYAEFYFTNTLWPDFHEEDFYQGILAYQKRDRRFGGLS